jgi:Type I 3-dehydroquinase
VHCGVCLLVEVSEVCNNLDLNWCYFDFWYFRPNWEGGQYQGDDLTRFNVLRSAIELGAEYVDIELKVCCTWYITTTFVDYRHAN